MTSAPIYRKVLLLKKHQCSVANTQCDVRLSVLTSVTNYQTIIIDWRPSVAQTTISSNSMWSLHKE